MSLRETPVTSGGEPLRAALWMAGAVASFSLMAVAGREMAGTLDTFEIMLYRSLIGVALVLGFALAAGRMADLETSRAGAHLTRNVFHFTGQNLWFYSVGVIPLAHVFALEFTVPLWVAALAPLVLGEAMTRVRVIAAVLGFLGILIVARPGITPTEFGHLTALSAALFFAGTYLATKRLARTETTLTILFWMTAMQSVMGLVTAGVDGEIRLPDGETWPWVLAVGVCGLSAHLCVTSALQTAPAMLVAPMDFARLPIIAVVGMVLYGEPLEVAVFAGGALILLGNLVNIRGEGRA